MDLLLICYIFILAETFFDIVLDFIYYKRVGIVDILIILNTAIMMTIVLMILNALNITFIFRIVMLVFIILLNFNFFINAIINMLYAKEQKKRVRNKYILYLFTSILVFILLFFIY